ncbi:AAA family ATPase [Vibrio sp.]|nr:AAA family ATPase [Vibrio sp.]
MAITKLAASEVYHQARLDNLSSKSTKDLAPIEDILGQERAQKAVEFAMSTKDKGYNIYAVGRNGLGKRTMILRYLNNHYISSTTLYDWCYIANFQDIRTPKILKLPAGLGQEFKLDIEGLMVKLLKALPLAFDNEMYFSRADILKNQLTKRQQSKLDILSKRSKEKSIQLTITAQGDYEFVALDGEQPYTEEKFEQLDVSTKDQFSNTIDELEVELRNMVRQLTEWEEEYSNKIKKLNDEVALDVIDHFITSLIDKYKELSSVKAYLQALRKDIVENADIFLEDTSEQDDMAKAALDKKLPRRYKINTIVSQESDTFPIVIEDNPNYHSLFGHVETATFKGTVFTDFSLIRGGSLHRANGGVLMMDAVKVLERPYVWDGLKRALRARQLSLTSLEKEVTLTGAVTLDPEPIPLDVKIILFGDYRTYQLLQHYDPEFRELFRVTADFEDEMSRTEESEIQYTRFIASVAHENSLLHCDKKSLSRIIEYSSRVADNQNKLSLDSAHIANLLRESHYVAKQSNANMIRVSHVEEALNNQKMRVSRLQDKVMEGYENGTTLIKVDGSAVGQVNALSVLATSEYAFGAPNRITATTAYGHGEVINIERNVDMSGSIHAKGVMTLSAYLLSIFGKTARVPLTTTITFEQSYGGVDGDSASMAEFCAIVSAFSGIPVQQHFAITGSMNQFGEAQPIGGLNEKIEGFYDVCALKGEVQGKGVIIPQSNVHNLMLRSDIVQAIGKGEFTIWAIEHVKEAVELLLGCQAGEADLIGSYDPMSVYGIAQAKLNALKV